MIRTMSTPSSRASTPARTAAAGSRRASGGRDRVLEAADRLFAERGFPDVSAAEIAREAGVAHGLLFHHFGSMEDLYVEVNRRAAARMDEAQLAAFQGPTVEAQLRAFLRVHMREIKRREADTVTRARNQATSGGAVTAIWEASRQRAIARIAGLVGLGSPDRRTRALLRAWLGFHDQLVLAWLAERALGEREVIDITLAQFEAVLRDHIGIAVELSGPASPAGSAG